ncbi:MAG: gliding motility-associatede transport system auxiliary component [Desulfovibrionales bacterium]|nr:gliding motility-associatede transport system auxiliary component [Desulfovibrionales bacterium]
MARMKRYSQTAAAGLLVVGLLVGLYLLAQSAGWRYDATSDRRHSLAPETIQVLDRLKEPVRALVFDLPGSPGLARTEDLLKLYARRSSLFSYEVIDPDKDPLAAKKLGVTRTGEVVVEAGGKQEKVSSPNEEKLTNAMIRAVDARKSTIYFVQGHGEFTPDPREHGSLSVLRQALESQGAFAQKIYLAREKDVPNDADALVIAGPAKDFLPSELSALTRYFKNGGRIFYAASAEDATNFDVWMANHTGIVREQGLVLDPVSQIVTGNYLTPIVQSYGFTPISRDFNLVTLYPTCTALKALPGGTGPRPAVLGESSKNSWLETDLKTLATEDVTFDPAADSPGPLWLSAVYEAPAAGADPKAAEPNTSRLVAFGDQDFLSDQYVNLSGNLDIAKNALNWLLAKEGLITISKPKPAQSLLLPRPGQSFFLMWTPLLVAPGIVLALGVATAIRRRRLN